MPPPSESISSNASDLWEFGDYFGFFYWCYCCNEFEFSKNFIKFCKVAFNCFDLAVYLSINAIMQDWSTGSVMTSEHKAISFSKITRTSSHGEYGT